MVEEEKSISDPDKEALLRCLRFVSKDEDSCRLSLDLKPNPEDKMEMLDDFVRFGR